MPPRLPGTWEPVLIIHAQQGPIKITVCSGEPFSVAPPDYMPDVPRMLCGACRLLVDANRAS